MTAAKMQDCVLDASVGIKLFIAEPLSEEAHRLFDLLTAEPPAQFFVPDLFYIECTNILWKYVKRLGMAPEDARVMVEQLGQLLLQATPTQLLIGDALEIALAHDLTAYDAVYVALAQKLGVPLVTADQPLVRSLAGSDHMAHWLGDGPSIS